MKKVVLALLLAGASSVFAQPRVSIGIQVGPGGPGPGRYAYAPYPPPPPPRAQIVPRSPGRGYVWVPGYWMQVNTRRGPDYQWQNGYWTQPPRGRNRWISPRYDRNGYYPGYWR